MDILMFLWLLTRGIATFGCMCVKSGYREVDGVNVSEGKYNKIRETSVDRLDNVTKPVNGHLKNKEKKKSGSTQELLSTTPVNGYSVNNGPSNRISDTNLKIQRKDSPIVERTGTTERVSFISPVKETTETNSEVSAIQNSAQVDCVVVTNNVIHEKNSNTKSVHAPPDGTKRISKSVISKSSVSLEEGVTNKEPFSIHSSDDEIEDKSPQFPRGSTTNVGRDSNRTSVASHMSYMPRSDSLCGIEESEDSADRKYSVDSTVYNTVSTRTSITSDDYRDVEVNSRSSQECLGPPLAVKIRYWSKNTAIVSWEPPNNVQRFENVEYFPELRKDNTNWVAAKFELKSSNSNRKVEIKELKETGTYHFRVVAVSDGVRGEPSDCVTLQRYHEFLDFEKDAFAKRLERPVPCRSQLKDFKLTRTIGTGSYGRVLLVQHIGNKVHFAMKVLEQKKTYEQKQVEHTLNERNILQAIRFPFIIGLKYHFKDKVNLYMVLDYACGGDLFDRIRSLGKLNQRLTRFYASQVVLAFEYLHHMNIIYRDLKPENILLDKDGYLKLTDFGFAKNVPYKTWTFAGTPEYLAPEVIESKGYTKAVDWWGLGILIFEMSAGYSPFYADRDNIIYENIMTGTMAPFPLEVQTNCPDLCHLVKNLLQRDLTRRYGNLQRGADQIKQHRWFKHLDWELIFQKRIVPPMPVKDTGDAAFGRFDEDPQLFNQKKQNPYLAYFKDF